MKVKFIPIALLLSMVLPAFGFDARAQGRAPLEPAQMPPRTMFYLIWRGAPSPDARKENSLLALWDDPDFAPVRAAMGTSLFGNSKRDATDQKLSPEEIQDFASLLENSFTLGYLSEPVRRAVSSAGAPTDPQAPDSATPKPPAWNGLFFVYDRTGKEALIAKAILGLRAQQKEPPNITSVMLGGVSVLKVQGRHGSSYWADTGKYAIATGERGVMAELLRRLSGKVSGSLSLAQTAAYREAQSIAGGGALEFFVRIPDLKNLASDAKAGPLQVRPLLDAIRIDAVHSLSGRVTFDGPKTHLQATILGDTSPGTLFDIWSAGQTAPASLALVPADAVSYTTGQLNLPGIYDVLKRVAHAAFPQAQQGNSDFFERAAQERLGMPLPDAIGLLTGEFASMQTSPSMDSDKQVFFFGIHKKPETLRLLRAIFSDQIASERNEGDATFLKVSFGGKQGNAGVAQWHFFHLAVTPDLILASSRAETLREVLANRGKGTAFASLASVPQFQAARAQFPESLNGSSYFDFQKVDWQALKDRWLAGGSSNSLASDGGTSGKTASKIPDWLARMNAGIISRHLHCSSSFSWKDSKGVHWEQWVE